MYVIHHTRCVHIFVSNGWRKTIFVTVIYPQPYTRQNGLKKKHTKKNAKAYRICSTIIKYPWNMIPSLLPRRKYQRCIFQDCFRIHSKYPSLKEWYKIKLPLWSVSIRKCFLALLAFMKLEFIYFKIGFKSNDLCLICFYGNSVTVWT